MANWASLVQSFSLASVYFKDLTAGISEVRWDLLSSTEDPLLLHLQKADLNKTIEALVSAGLNPRTPTAAFADLPQQESFVKGELGDIALKSSKLDGENLYLLIASEIPSPATSQKLAGKKILITRARSQAMDLSELLRREGAVIYEIPTISIILNDKKMQKLSTALKKVQRYSWLILTSVNSVNILNNLLKTEGTDWSIFQHLKIACIGKATATRVEEYGAAVHLVPDRYQAEGLIETLFKEGVRGKRILLPRAEKSRELLPKMLEQAGATVDEINIYRAELPDSSRAELTELLTTTELDFITFTSSSTVRNFMEIAGEFLATRRSGTKIACIGPITADTLKEYGIMPDVVAEEFTIAGLVHAIVKSQTNP